MREESAGVRLAGSVRLVGSLALGFGFGFGLLALGVFLVSCCMRGCGFYV